jgi:hypothetical protein
MGGWTRNFGAAIGSSFFAALADRRPVAFESEESHTHVGGVYEPVRRYTSSLAPFGWASRGQHLLSSNPDQGERLASLTGAAMIIGGVALLKAS